MTGWKEDQGCTIKRSKQNALYAAAVQIGAGAHAKVVCTAAIYVINLWNLKK